MPPLWISVDEKAERIEGEKRYYTVYDHDVFSNGRIT